MPLRVFAAKAPEEISAKLEFLVTQSGVEVVQDPKLSKDDRPLWVAIEAFDLAVFEFEHVAARCVYLLTRGWQLAKGKLQWAVVVALQGQLHYNDITIDIDAMLLAMHVGKRRAVVAERVGEGATTVGRAHRIVDEHPSGVNRLIQPSSSFRSATV